MPIEPLLGGSYEGFPNASVDEVSVAELMTGRLRCSRIRIWSWLLSRNIVKGAYTFICVLELSVRVRATRSSYRCRRLLRV